MSKVAIIAKLTAAEGKRDDLVAALTEHAVAAVADEPGCEIYAPHADTGDEVTVWFYELYTDGDALAAHGKTEGFAAMGAALGGLLAGAPEIHVLDPIVAKGLEL
ncbi:MAG: antibiotic biosynthesis monooxygenase [Actinomycetota bacterium]